ncbi:mitochondrial fission factor isoform X2 [Microcaecilia unicolor]|nr:mitochondrial fission factor isoform X2 [Microcaecilia unicolor]XP_030072479.1 mitochondrial fission factor isoform X2 [Microcaecilia unicolor]XP_030072480.1 mitochondrial fission factor isoform X2 [Microcaecilia unicolor]XP_030072481.1 mitochondrial fission factor isoform X2 [Microcaecilia unicolor]
MNEATFPSPAAEMAEMNRIQYEIEYTEGISQRMRVPEKLKVAPTNTNLEQKLEEELPNTGVIMQVPERIVIAGDSEDIPFSRPPDLDLIQSTPYDTLALKTPPRVLTLSERPLDFLDLERPLAMTPQNEELHAVGRLKRERSMSENAIRQNGQLVRNDSMWHGSSCVPKHKLKASFQSSVSTKKRITVTPTQQQARVCPSQMIPEDGANLYSARGILSFIQSSTRRAYQQVLEVLDDNHRAQFPRLLSALPSFWRAANPEVEPIEKAKPALRGGSTAATSSNPHHDNTRYGLSNVDSMLEVTPDDMTVVDATSLRRQIIKLNRRLLLLEEENKERAKREMIMYSITVAFWLLNSWLWFRR